MQNLNQKRKRRAKSTRAKIAQINSCRLSVHRTNSHIYAQLIDQTGSKVLASASTLEPALRNSLSNGGNISAASIVGKNIAERAIDKGIKAVSFDRAGYKYHGRIKALANAAREHGLKF